MTARKRITGFTLVELLIVIALLGVIALIVIAAINPIEQRNRARDTGMKSDASQMLSAIDRYFAAKAEFPWVTADVPTGVDNEDIFGLVSASNEGVGVCGATCSVDGLLLTSQELKTEFRNRAFVQADATAYGEQIMLGKLGGASSSVYACYVPLSRSNREKAVSDALVYHVDETNGSRTVTADCDATTADWTTLRCYVCIPE